MTGLRGLARRDYERKAEEFIAELAHKPVEFRGARYLGTSSMTVDAKMDSMKTDFAQPLTASNWNPP